MASRQIVELASKKCARCEGIDPISPQAAENVLKDLPGWALSTGSIEKEFRFKSYSEGLEFAYAIGMTADAENHHPEMLVRWRRVSLVWSTHSINGLSQNDFIMAAKCELEYERGR